MPQRDPKTGRFIKTEVIEPIEHSWPPIQTFQLPERATLFQLRCRAKMPDSGERCLFRRGHASEHGAPLDFGMGWWD